MLFNKPKTLVSIQLSPGKVSNTSMNSSIPPSSRKTEHVVGLSSVRFLKKSNDYATKHEVTLNKSTRIYHSADKVYFRVMSICLSSFLVLTTERSFCMLIIFEPNSVVCTVVILAANNKKSKIIRNCYQFWFSMLIFTKHRNNGH